MPESTETSSVGFVGIACFRICRPWLEPISTNAAIAASLRDD